MILLTGCMPPISDRDKILVHQISKMCWRLPHTNAFTSCETWRKAQKWLITLLTALCWLNFIPSQNSVGQVPTEKKLDGIPDYTRGAPYVGDHEKMLQLVRICKMCYKTTTHERIHKLWNMEKGTNTNAPITNSQYWLNTFNLTKNYKGQEAGAPEKN
jgi:hypothetical protein